MEVPEGTRLLLDATPGAREDRFPDGLEPWRGRLGIRVRAAAQDDAANRAVLDLVAMTLAVPTASVALVAGGRDRRKDVLVRGLAADAVAGRLAPLLDGTGEAA